MIDNRFKIVDILKRVLIICLFTVISCPKKDTLLRLQDGDFAIVVKGRFSGRPTFLNQGRQYKNLVDDLRGKIEKNRDILPLITKKFFSATGRLIYKFKFVAFDEEKNSLILRYFARTMNHPVYAGYQIQFVFDLKTKDITEIYTAEVPYE